MSVTPRFLTIVAATAVLLTTMATPAHAQTYDLCQLAFVTGAVVEIHWDCGGARAVGKTFDYVVVGIFAGDGRDYYIRRMEVPDSPNIRNSTTGYAWGTFAGEDPGYGGRYIKWILVEDGSVRCWDDKRRSGYMIEIDPSLCG